MSSLIFWLLLKSIPTCQVQTAFAGWFQLAQLDKETGELLLASGQAWGDWDLQPLLSSEEGKKQEQGGVWGLGGEWVTTVEQLAQLSCHMCHCVMKVQVGMKLTWQEP